MRFTVIFHILKKQQEYLKMTKEINFEQALAELEEIVKKLESGDIALDDAISAYERGSELKKICTEKLNQAKARIDKLNIDENGATTENFEG